MYKSLKEIKTWRMVACLLSMMALFPIAACAGPAGSLPSPASQPPAGAPPMALTMTPEDSITNLDVPWEMAFAPDGRIFLT
jgi:glucose/arabinose dehydrogenase